MDSHIWLARRVLPLTARCEKMQPMTQRFNKLPPEPFGRKLTRAREDVAGLRMDQLANAISAWHPCTSATISRLENNPDMMPNANMIVMVLAVLGCGFDPQEFGLSLDDLPSAWDRKAVIESMTAHS
jgi:hypothetical protein